MAVPLVPSPPLLCLQSKVVSCHCGLLSTIALGLGEARRTMWGRNTSRGELMPCIVANTAWF
jgi:hypothetical protein